MKRFKVRFHLARGKNYMHWQVHDTMNNYKEYINPKKARLVMSDCQLRNHSKTSRKIYEGMNKTVCAWIECDMVEYITKFAPLEEDLGPRITYNPRVHPHWQMEDDDNVDYENFKQLGTDNKRLFVLRR